MERKNAWAAYAEDDSRVEAFAKAYCDFINNGKTERECVAYGEKLAKAHGFEDLNAVVRSGRKLEAGARVYANWMGKSFMLFVLGEKPLEEGMNILGAHIDSPRIDVKQNPLYEDTDLAYLDTHYYGGIKKYQWVAIPLALHGVIVRKTGEKVIINIGEDENDPVFCISDLLVHLAQEQMTKNAKEVVEGEALNLIVGGRPLEGEEKDAVKKGVLEILNQKYGVCEEDFLSAELEAVPASNARDVGFDRAFVASYGHDDRVCAYPEITATLDTDTDQTVMCILADKEEIGSEGNTGMQCVIISDLIDEIAKSFGANPSVVREHSKCISADVTAAYDPSFASAFEEMNVGYVNKGVTMNKFTGARGKSGSNDASAEYIAYLRGVFAKENVVWQTGELGRVDLGGGGTVAKYISKMNIDTVDMGVPVLSMHAPNELISKADLYAAHKAFSAFVK